MFHDERQEQSHDLNVFVIMTNKFPHNRIYCINLLYESREGAKSWAIEEKIQIGKCVVLEEGVVAGQLEVSSKYINVSLFALLYIYTNDVYPLTTKLQFSSHSPTRMENTRAGSFPVIF